MVGEYFVRMEKNIERRLPPLGIGTYRINEINRLFLKRMMISMLNDRTVSHTMQYGSFDWGCWWLPIRIANSSSCHELLIKSEENQIFFGLQKVFLCQRVLLLGCSKNINCDNESCTQFGNSCDYLKREIIAIICEKWKWRYSRFFCCRKMV